MIGSISPKGYNNIRKADIIAAVAAKAKTTKKAATEIVNAYWETIKTTLKTTLKNKRKANIIIPNVGSIRCITKAARTYSTKGLKNTTKKTVKVGAKTIPKFYVSDNFLKESATKKKKKKATTKAKTGKSTAKKRKTTQKSKKK